MGASYKINQVELCNWLQKADHHYLSARLLYLHGLLFAAEENAGFAIELILKSACKNIDADMKQSHKITKLWESANPPITLDAFFTEYLDKLEDVLYAKHPDAKAWSEGRSANDQFDALDYLYLTLRNWLIKSFPVENCIPTELDLAIEGKSLFNNVVSRHGAWDMGTILKRSNNRYSLLQKRKTK